MEFSIEGDGGEISSVIFFPAPACRAVAEIIFSIGERADVKIIDFFNTRFAQTPRAEPGKIKLTFLIIDAGAEKSCRTVKFGSEGAQDIETDFKIWLPQTGTRAPRRIFPFFAPRLSIAATVFSRIPGEGAAPAGVSSADDAGFRVGEQPRHAVSRKGAESQSPGVVTSPSAVAGPCRPRTVNDDDVG